MKEEKSIAINKSTEKYNLRVLNLEADIGYKIINENGKKLKWYGKRLSLIRNFYNKTRVDLGKYLKLSAKEIATWESNFKKPSIDKIKLLEFFFEVREGFFTDELVNLTFVEQDKIIEK